MVGLVGSHGWHFMKHMVAMGLHCNSRGHWSRLICTELGFDWSCECVIVADCPLQAICLLTSLFGRKIVMLEIRVAALVRSQQGHDAGRHLSVLPRYGLPE